MSASPLPYSEASSTTTTFLADSTDWMYLAAAGPCEASLPSTRKKVFQPLLASAGLVADGVMATRPASLNLGSAALLSPEKAGPTSPMTVLSSTAFCASEDACAGSPWVSNSLSLTWQLAFLVLYWSIASLAPFLMFWPRLAASPVRAPKKPICRLQLLPPLPLLEPPAALVPPVVPPQAVSARAAATSGAPSLTMDRTWSSGAGGQRRAPAAQDGESPLDARTIDRSEPNMADAPAACDRVVTFRAPYGAAHRARHGGTYSGTYGVTSPAEPQGWVAQGQALPPGMPATTASATSRMLSRRSIDVFWIHRKASGSLSPSRCISTPLPRSTCLRVSNRSARSATSDSNALSCA